MTLASFIRTAIFGPDTSIEDAEAAYIQAKAGYDDAVVRRDTRDQNRCLKALNVALNDMLRVHSLRSYPASQEQRAGVAQ